MNKTNIRHYAFQNLHKQLVDKTPPPLNAPSAGRNFDHSRGYFSNFEYHIGFLQIQVKCKNNVY